MLKMRVWNIKENRWATMEELLGDIPVSATLNPPSILTCGGEGWIVELFTGLPDKDGKEVFDGDLFNFDGGIARAEWCDDLARYLAVFADGSDLMLHAITHRCAVIGNIHEHKNLLDRDREEIE